MKLQTPSTKHQPPPRRRALARRGRSTKVQALTREVKARQAAELAAGRSLLEMGIAHCRSAAESFSDAEMIALACATAELAGELKGLVNLANLAAQGDDQSVQLAEWTAAGLLAPSGGVPPVLQMLSGGEPPIDRSWKELFARKMIEKTSKKRI